MAGECIIYGLCDPRSSELRYVGKTVQSLELRLRGHCKPSSTARSTHAARWIRSLVAAGVKPDIFTIEVVSTADQNDAERFWIAYFRLIGADLTNFTDGGTGGPTRTGAKLTNEHKERLLAGLAKARSDGRILKHFHTEAQRRQISIRRKGIKFTEEHRANIAKAKRGKPLSEEHRQHIAEANKTAKRPDDFGDRISRGKKGRYTSAMQIQIQRLREHRANKPPELQRTNTRLIIDQVREIKALLSEGQSLNSLAKRFGVNKRTILFIKQGKTWKDVV